MILVAEYGNVKASVEEAPVTITLPSKDGRAIFDFLVDKGADSLGGGGNPVWALWAALDDIYGAA